MAHWLMKNEPDEFGYDHLVKAKRGGWDGVRNFQARNFLRQMAKGDLVLFYHSSTTPPGVAGIAKIVKTAEPDPTQFDPASEVLRPEEHAREPALGLGDRRAGATLRYVTLDELRSIPEMAGSRLLARGNRLSVLPLTEAEFDAVIRYADGH
jgi:predicted RNA-binding protein with PUA-like domain